MARKTAAQRAAATAATAAETPTAPATPSLAGKAAKTVTVACKLPHGLRLRLFKMVDSHENVSGNNVRAIKRAEQIGAEVVIAGVATPFGREKVLSGGYALTKGVDAEFFAKWMEQNAEHDAVKNKMIFAAATRDAIEGETEEHKKDRSGQEPLDMSMVKRGERVVAADPRMPRTSNRNLSEIAPDTEKASG